MSIHPPSTNSTPSAPRRSARAMCAGSGWLIVSMQWLLGMREIGERRRAERRLLRPPALDAVTDDVNRAGDKASAELRRRSGRPAAPAVGRKGGRRITKHEAVGAIR